MHRLMGHQILSRSAHLTRFRRSAVFDHSKDRYRSRRYRPDVRDRAQLNTKGPGDCEVSASQFTVTPKITMESAVPAK